MILWGACALSLGVGGGGITSGHHLTIQVLVFWTLFGRIFMTAATYSTANLPQGPDIPGLSDLVCTSCDTAHALLIRSIGTIIPASPGRVSIEYTCSACGSFHVHGATVQQVATLLPTAAATSGVLHIGSSFIHCGEPMTEAADANPRLARPAGNQRDRFAAISTRTRLLTCHC